MSVRNIISNSLIYASAIGGGVTEIIKDQPVGVMSFQEGLKVGVAALISALMATIGKELVTAGVNWFKSYIKSKLQ